MQLNQSPKININYCAKIVEIHDFTPHPNPKCERLKCAHIDGYTISVSKDTEPGISADVLCKRQLKWKDKVAGWLTYVPDTAYDYLWSSRKVVKNQYYNKEVSEGYYGCDVWGEAHKVLQPFLTKGLTLYYEIIGWLPTGGAIQSMGGKAYDYGYDMPIWDPTTPYKYNVHFGIRVYRITYTNPDGIVYEFSARQVQQWCKDKGLTPVTELYYEYAKDLYPDISVSELHTKISRGQEFLHGRTISGVSQ